MAGKQHKKRNPKPSKQVQGHSSWEEMGQDGTLTNVFIARPFYADGAQMVHYSNLSTRKDDCISSTSANVRWVCWG